MLFNFTIVTIWLIERRIVEDASWNKQSVIGRLFGADNRPKHYRCTSSAVHIWTSRCPISVPQFLSAVFSTVSERPLTFLHRDVRLWRTGRLPSFSLLAFTCSCPSVCLCFNAVVITLYAFFTTAVCDDVSCSTNERTIFEASCPLVQSKSTSQPAACSLVIIYDAKCHRC